MSAIPPLYACVQCPRCCAVIPLNPPQPLGQRVICGVCHGEVAVGPPSPPRTAMSQTVSDEAAWPVPTASSYEKYYHKAVCPHCKTSNSLNPPKPAAARMSCHKCRKEWSVVDAIAKETKRIRNRIDAGAIWLAGMAYVIGSCLSPTDPAARLAGFMFVVCVFVGVRTIVFAVLDYIGQER